MVRTRCPTTQRSAMSTKELRRNEATGSTSVVDLDMKLEVVVIPVSDVDHAKKFYSRLGWRLDADRSAGDNFRLVQFTPPGSGSSIQFGVNLTSAAPGSAQAMLLAVSDIEDARQQLVAKGVDVSEVFHCAEGTACRFQGVGVRISGPQPNNLSYSSFVSFTDPDGNGSIRAICRLAPWSNGCPRKSRFYGVIERIMPNHSSRAYDHFPIRGSHLLWATGSGQHSAKRLNRNRIKSTLGSTRRNGVLCKLIRNSGS
jgi:predicted enzyme related to lactoylglutathione lyase